MGPTHFDKCAPKWYHFFGGHEKSGKFSLRGRRHDEFDDLGEREDGTVEFGDGVVLGAENVRSTSATGFGDVEVRSVGVAG